MAKAGTSRKGGLAAALLRLSLIGAAGAAFWGAAGLIASEVENRTEVEVRRVLLRDGYDWVRPQADGLRLILTGTAPDEVARFRLLAAMAGAAPHARIVDELSVAQRQTFTPPDFEVEILRNDDGLSLMGLVPSRTDREAIAQALTRSTGARQVSSFLGTASYPPPENWQAALDYGLRIAAMTPRATISVAPGRVSVNAVADNPTEKARLETELRRNLPAGVTLDTRISAPLAVIAPFVLRFVLDEDGARLDVCAADSETARDGIEAAAQAAGLTTAAGCQLGIGAPSARWGEVAGSAITAIDRMGAGQLNISDRSISIIAPASVTEEVFSREIAALRASLPAPFTLSAERETPVDQSDGPPHFSALLDGDGPARIEGRVGSAEMIGVVENMARARLGPVEGSIGLDPTMPADWSTRIIAGLEAMDSLIVGRLDITPDRITITGLSGDAFASDRAIAALSQRLGAGAGYALRIGYDKWRDNTLDLASGTECVDRLNVAMAETGIGFEPGGAVIAGETDLLLDRLGAVLEDCADYRVEVAGHTDAQGSEEGNMALSLARAQAVLDKMTEAGLSTANMTAEGYGPTRPIETNDTPEGREANRRIEFELLSPDPVEDGAALQGLQLAGLTPAPEDAPVPPEPVAPPPEPEPETPRPDWAEPDMTDDEIAEVLREMDALVVQSPGADTPRPQERPGDLAPDGAGAQNDENSEAP